MKIFRFWISLVVVFVMMAALGSACTYGQGAFSSNLGIGVIVVKGIVPLGHGIYSYVAIPGKTAVGFATRDCEFVTTFSVVEEYERAQTWRVDQESKDARRRNLPEYVLEVTFEDHSYRGELRPVGVYPMGLDLACIDIPHTDSGMMNIRRLGLSIEEGLIRDRIVPSDTIEGTPTLNKAGVVTSMYVGRDHESVHVLTAENIRWFLGEVKKVPRTRPMLLKP